MGLPFVRSRLALAFVAGTSLFAARLAAQPAVADPIAQVSRQFREYFLDDPYAMRDNNEPVPNIAEALNHARTVGRDGSWGDVKYQSSARSGWEPALHCNRIQAMAIAAGLKSTSPADRAVLLKGVHAAFGYWISHDFQCTNWWYNQIGIPKILGTAAVILGQELQPDEYAFVTGTLLARYPIAMTGQNRIWLSDNALMRGLLLKDPKLVKQAADTIWSEVAVQPEEGLQADSSFHQHGPQQQMGNYGLAFAVEECRASLILRGSPWAMPEDKFGLFRDYLLQGENWVSWRGRFDISACDRQLMPKSPIGKTESIGRVMELSAVTDPSHASQYRAYIERNHPDAPNDLVGDRFFWRSDYYIHRTSGYAITLKLSSNRVIGSELVNSENLSGYHEGDGALYLYASGSEYDDIFPLWDWGRLPGVTCAAIDPPPFKTTRVPTDFVGGIAAGDSGVAVLDYARDGLKAHKAWFFCPQGVVCLGAGISGVAEARVTTTLNQSLLNGPVTFHAARSTTTIPGGSERTLRSPDWIEHDGWRYTILDHASVQVSTLQVLGSWSKVFRNPETPITAVSHDIFLASIDHSATPSNATYAYAASPAGASPSVKVLANTAALQAVAMADGATGVVFWKAGEIQVPGGPLVKAGSPCLVWVQAGVTLVCDPTQKLHEIALSVGGNSRIVKLPAGMLAGTAVSL